MDERWILVLEDGEDDAVLLTREYMRLHVEERLTVVSDGDAAISILMRTVVPPCLVVVDYRLPKMDGIEVVREMRRMPWLQETPIVVVATCGGVGIEQLCVEAGANAFAVKPLDYEEYRVFLGRLLDYRKLDAARAEG